MNISKPFNIHLGDCREVLETMADSSVHSIVTDPPYGLKFMGKKWDCDVPCVEIWEQCLRVLKPGGHLLAFAGTRTQHRMAVGIEDAGFEIRDVIAWVYGSGFPKSLDVSKAIDKAAGVEREVVGRARRDAGSNNDHAFTSFRPIEFDITTPATDAARQWHGWGTALKPALEPITMARKPLTGTVSSNVLEHGTGGINVDGCRVGATVETWPRTRARPADGQPNALYTHKLAGNDLTQTVSTGAAPSGRWPANLIHDGSEEFKTITCDAARFFYCAKASKADRDEGCEGIDERLSMRYGEKAQGPLPQQTPSKPVAQGNHHPTVKPTALMRYLCRLVTPPNGIVLDPFMGSGSTGKAAIMEGFSFIGIERESEYVEIAKKRIGSQVDLFSRKAI